MKFRFHQIRPGERWNYADLDRGARIAIPFAGRGVLHLNNKIIEIDIEPAASLKPQPDSTSPQAT